MTEEVSEEKRALEIRRVVESVIQERSNTERDEIKEVFTALLAAKVDERHRQSGLKETIKEVVFENAPDIVKANATSRRYALVFGGIALVASVINILAAVWNGFDQSSTLKTQTHIITMQTLAERAGIAEQLAKAVVGIEQVTTQLSDVKSVLDEKESSKYTYFGPKQASWALTNIKFIPNYCDDKSSSTQACRTGKVYQLIKNVTFDENPGGQIQLAAVLENFVSNMDTILGKINLSASGSSSNLFGVLISARDLCKNPAEAVIPSDSRNTNARPTDYRSILSIESALEATAKSVRPVLDRYKQLRGEKINTPLGNPQDLSDLQDNEMKFAIHNLKVSLDTRIEDDFDDQLNVQALGNLIGEGLKSFQDHLPAVIGDCKGAGSVGTLVIQALKPSKDDWSKLTQSPDGN